ncbi:MAG: DUF177 domain-containing protein [bacterium]|nr:DUF177 domain-containing protein [bacterium]
MPPVIVIAAVPPEGVRLRGEVPAAEFGLDVAGVTVSGALRYDLFAETASGLLLVRGSLALPVALACARCLRPVESEVRADGYRFSAPIAEIGEEIDLTPGMREDIIMALPYKPLCSRDCRGICPRCGADRNVERCACREGGGDDRWGALDGLAAPPEGSA